MRFRTSLNYLLLWMSVLWGASPGTAYAGDSASSQNLQAQVRPYHVFARVTVFRHELERLRVYMGKPIDKRSELGLQNAAPREAFFQAITLFKKANRLGFEITSENAPTPKSPDEDIQPAHVLTVVDAALDRIQHIQNRLGIAARMVEPTLDDAKTSTDVFCSIVQANRQLNILLSKKFSPSDVYQQVSLAMSYTFRLANYLAPTRMPEAPAFAAGKRPADVYRKLLDCFHRIQAIAGISGINMLELAVSPADIESAEPSDVYDIASLIVSELAYLHGRLQDARLPYIVHPPGLKFPSHVYQRACLLETQLTGLQSLVQGNPTWQQNNHAER